MACPIGSYSPGSTTVCTPCAAGTVDQDSNPATPCTACPSLAFQSALGQTVCVPSTNCTTGTYQAQAITPTSDRICLPISVCSTRFQFSARDPTPTSDRLCLSNLAAYSVLTFNTIVATPALASTQALYPELVLNGSLLDELQTTSALYSNVVLIYLPTPGTLSFSDNPPPGQAFIIAGVTLTNFASPVLTDRLLYDFVAGLVNVSALNSSSVAIFPTNSSQSLALNVFFRVQVPASSAPGTLQLLTAALNGSGLATALAGRNGAFSTFVVLLPPYIVYHVGTNSFRVMSSVRQCF